MRYHGNDSVIAGCVLVLRGLAIWLVCGQIAWVAFWAFVHVRMAIQQVWTNISRSSVKAYVNSHIDCCWLLIFTLTLLAKK